MNGPFFSIHIDCLKNGVGVLKEISYGITDLLVDLLVEIHESA